LMLDHGGTPAPWSEREIDALAEFVVDQEHGWATAQPWLRDDRLEDTYEGTRPGSHEVLVVNLGDRLGFLDAAEELKDRFTLLSPDERHTRW